MKIVILIVSALASLSIGAGPPGWGEEIKVSVGCWSPLAISWQFLESKMLRRITEQMTGPNGPIPKQGCSLACYDMDDDGDIDLFDWAEFEVWMSEDDPSARVEWVD